jgi:hypothetical protein
MSSRDGCLYRAKSTVVTAPRSGPRDRILPGAKFHLSICWGLASARWDLSEGWPGLDQGSWMTALRCRPARAADRTLGSAISNLYSQCVEGEGDTGTDARRAVAAKLEELIEFLSQSALDELRGAMNTILQTDETKVAQAAPELHSRLELIKELAEFLDKVDPHSIPEREFQELFRKRPTELVEDALVKGKLRERRIMIEAKDAEISRKLLRWTWVAAIAGVLASLGAVAAVIISALK